MSKNPKPTSEELKFVYALLAKGYKEKDILAEYCQLHESGQLLFPFRTDKRFVRDRMREFAAADEVLGEEIKAKADPLFMKRKDEHFAHLAKIATFVVENIREIEEVSHLKPSKLIYTVLFPNDHVTTMNQQQLTDYIRERIVASTSTFGALDWELFREHMKEDFPEFVSESFSNGVEKRPYEVIKSLLLLSRQKIFKGKCQGCPD